MRSGKVAKTEQKLQRKRVEKIELWSIFDVRERCTIFLLYARKRGTISVEFGMGTRGEGRVPAEWLRVD